MAVLAISRDTLTQTVSMVRMITSDALNVVDASGYLTAQIPVIEALMNGIWQWLGTDEVLVNYGAVQNADGSITPGTNALFQVSADLTTLIATGTAGTVTLVGAAVVGHFPSFDSTGGALIDNGYLPSNPAYTDVVMANTPTVANTIPIFNDTAGSITDSAYSIVNSLLEAPAVSALTAHSGGGQTSALALTKAINNVTTVAAAGDSVRLPASAAGLEITITNSGANSMQVYGAGTDTINGIATGTGVAQLPGQTVVYTAAVAGNWLANVASNPNSILFASVPITASQFNGMYAAPMLLVAAPGANKLISVESMELIMTFGSADYAAGGIVFAQYDSTADGAGAKATNTEAAADFFAAASTTFQFIGTSGNTVGALPFSTTVNKGLYLSNATQPFTTGDSTWVAKIYYRIVNTVGAL